MNKQLLDLIDRDSCYAIIPARGGSKSVPGKNIRIFQRYPLIAYSIAAAKLTKNVSRTIVSTDSEEIACIAKRYGAEVPFLRPSEYAQDNSPDIDVMKHVIVWLGENEKKIPRYFVHLRPTTPIRDSEIIDKAVYVIKRDDRATSLRSGSICTHPPFKWFKKEEEYLEPLMPGMTCDETNLPRQDFPKVYIPNGYVDVVKTDFIIERNLLHGDRMIGFETEEVPDIDTEDDLKKIELYGIKNILITLQKYLEDVQGGR